MTRQNPNLKDGSSNNNQESEESSPLTKTTNAENENPLLGDIVAKSKVIENDNSSSDEDQEVLLSDKEAENPVHSTPKLPESPRKKSKSRGKTSKKREEEARYIEIKNRQKI